MEELPGWTGLSSLMIAGRPAVAPGEAAGETPGSSKDSSVGISGLARAGSVVPAEYLLLCSRCPFCDRKCGMAPWQGPGAGRDAAAQPIITVQQL